MLNFVEGDLLVSSGGKYMAKVIRIMKSAIVIEWATPGDEDFAVGEQIKILKQDYKTMKWRKWDASSDA